MAKKKTKQVKRVSRGRNLTHRESARYNKVRKQIDKEKPLINDRIKAKLATAETILAIGRQLKAIREAQGKSLADIRNLTGMDRSAISKLERGERENQSVATLVRYAQALGKTVTVAIADQD